jgi:hypothetical protein
MRRGGHLRQRRDKLLLRATQIAKLIREHIL